MSKRSKKFFCKNIKFVTFKSNFLEKISKRSKYVLSLLLLTKEVLINKNSLVVSVQANIYCGLLSKLLGFKLIIRSNTSPDGWPKNIIKKFLYSLSFKAANKVIVNSNEFKKKIKKSFNINAECIYNALNKREIINLSKKPVNFNFFSKNYLKVLNVGRLEDQKDQMTLLKSINFLKTRIKIKLLIIGNGSMEKKLKYYIYKNNLDRTVKILNNISNPFPYFIKSDLFVLSSVFEGLPNVLLEALTLKNLLFQLTAPLDHQRYS